MKKTLVSALTTALVVGAASTTFAAANPFSDVPADQLQARLSLLQIRSPMFLLIIGLMKL